MKIGWLVTLLLGMLLSLGLGTYAAAKGYLDRDADQQLLTEIRDRLNRIEQRIESGPPAASREGLDSEPAPPVPAEEFIPPTAAPSPPTAAPIARGIPAAGPVLGPGSSRRPASTAAIPPPSEPRAAPDPAAPAPVEPAGPAAEENDALDFGPAPPPPPGGAAGARPTNSPASHLLNPVEAEEPEPVVPRRPRATRVQ